MKNTKIKMINKLTCLVLLIAIGCSSCANYTEELWLNEDGSGKYSLTADLSSMLEMMENFSEMETQDTLGEKTSFWDGIGGEEVDSVLQVKDSIPAHVLNQLENPELLDNISMRMKASKSRELFQIVTLFEFSSLDELDMIMKTMAKATELSKTENDENAQISADEGLQLLTSRKDGHGFSLTKGKLSRKVTEADKVMLQEFTKDEESVSMLEMMLEESKFTTIIHLPGKPKKVTDKHKVGKIKGNSVWFEYDMLNLIKGDVSSDFEVTFKQ